MQRERVGANFWLACLSLVLLAELCLGQAAWAQRPESEPDLGPASTPKQQREWLEWNHRRVQGDVRRLAELAQQVSEQADKFPRDRLPAALEDRIEALREKVVALSQEFEKTNPHILPLGVVGRAEAIQAEAKILRESFEQADRDRRPFARLRSLTRQIEARAKRIAERLRQP